MTVTDQGGETMIEESYVLLIADEKGTHYSPNALVIEHMSFQTKFSDMEKAIEECVKIKSVYQDLKLSISIEKAEAV